MKKVIVTHMTIGQLVDRLFEGDVFYWEGKRVVLSTSGAAGIHVSGGTITMDIESLGGELRAGMIYQEFKDDWWAGLEGTIIMVAEYCSDVWFPVIFKRYRHDSVYPFKASTGECYMNARMLTEDEKNSIVTGGDSNE